MKKNLLFVSAFILALLAVGCGGNVSKNSLTEGASGDMLAYESSAVSAIEQARPTIMIFPGDQTLQALGCLKVNSIDGRQFTTRDYAGYLLKDGNAKQLYAAIQNHFNAQNYPLSDLEQTLKQLNNQDALDMADGFDKDAKTMLLTTARPDIILELNYDVLNNQQMSMVGHNYSQQPATKSLNYTLNAIDAYSSKVVATISGNSISGTTVIDAISKHIDANMAKFQGDIMQYFSDILTRGRDISVRITVLNGSGLNLSDLSIEGDTYADWIIDFVKTHTVKGAYKMQMNTDKELSFVNCRIRLINEDGTQYGVYDWTRDLARSLRQNLGLKVTNKSQGLGEAVLVIEEQ